MGIKILATGSCLPQRVVTNEELSAMVDTSDEWIVKRTGIHERRYVQEETLLSMTLSASRQALERAGVDKHQIGAVLVATLGGERITPSCACQLQADLGLPEDIVCFDLNAACAGFLYALKAVQGLLTEQKPYGLVVGGELLTKLTDFTDRGTCVLFGDGAGAAVVEGGPHIADNGMVLGSRGDREVLYIPGFADEAPSYIHMNGTAVFKFAVDIIAQCVEQVSENTGVRPTDCDLVVFHQANERIIDHAAKKLSLPEEKVPKIIGKYGNMSAACIPILLDELYTQGRLHAGMKLLCVGFGGGLSWAGGLFTIGGNK